MIDIGPNLTHVMDACGALIMIALLIWWTKS